MIKFYIYANGIFWGAWMAHSEKDALKKAAHDMGTDASTDGLKAVKAASQKMGAAQ